MSPTLGMPPFGGMRVIESVYCVADGAPRQERRNWRDRLLTRPWRPWQAERTVIPRVPTAFQVGNTLYAHPEFIETLRRVAPAVVNEEKS